MSPGQALRRLFNPPPRTLLHPAPTPQAACAFVSPRPHGLAGIFGKGTEYFGPQFYGGAQGRRLRLPTTSVWAVCRVRSGSPVVGSAYLGLQPRQGFGLGLEAEFAGVFCEERLVPALDEGLPQHGCFIDGFFLVVDFRESAGGIH